jgi:predicted MFS family arabinose efflux permease
MTDLGAHAQPASRAESAESAGPGDGVDLVGDPASPALGRRLSLILAVAAGVSVANVYFPQAMSPLVAAGLGVRPATAALVATTTQLGYAAGIFLLVPLGDRLRHRSLIVTLLTVTGLALLGAAGAPTLAVLVGFSALIGLTTVVPQIIFPMAAGLVSDDRRGATVGTLMGGLLGGILLARAFGGLVGGWLGWRVTYLTAAVLALTLAAVLRRLLPTTVPASRQRYPALLADAGRLLRSEPELRRSCLYQAMLFGGFSAAWTSLALLVTGSRYGLDTQAVGLIALVGAGSMLCAPVAGRWVDRRGPDPVSLVGILGAIVAAGILLGADAGGAPGLVALVAGMLVLDTAVQCAQAANQSRIFALRPEARGRLNTAYMTCTFVGGAAGSWLGARAYTIVGWPGVCALVAAGAAVAFTRHVARRRTFRAPDRPGPS